MPDTSTTTQHTRIAQRPQRADARRNFDALLASARDAFAAKGTSASLEDIARRAGVGIGTLYRNFPTRDALIEAVYVDEVESVVRAAREAASLEPWQALTTWLHRFVSYIGTKRALLDGLNKDSPVLLSCRTAIYDGGDPLLARAQAAGVVRGDVTIDDVVRMVSGIAGVSFEEDAQRSKVVELAIDGLRTRA